MIFIFGQIRNKIRMRKFKNFVVINENYDIAKQILSENNISRDDDDFKKLEKLLKKNIGLIGLFTRFMFRNT